MVTEFFEADDVRHHTITVEVYRSVADSIEQLWSLIFNSMSYNY